jgi:hypothetical protein
MARKRSDPGFVEQVARATAASFGERGDGGAQLGDRSGTKQRAGDGPTVRGD